MPVLPVYRDSRLVLEGEDLRAAGEVAARVRAARETADAARTDG